MGKLLTRGLGPGGGAGGGPNYTRGQTLATYTIPVGSDYTIDPNADYIVLSDYGNVLREGGGAIAEMLTFDVPGGARINAYDGDKYLISSTFVPRT